MGKKLYDAKCYELACYFFDGTAKDTEAERDDLADTIQRTIEDSLQNVPLGEEKHEDRKVAEVITPLQWD